ncbi:MAG: serine acetyltransferase [Rikenellaceae bacterium]|nr:serine acetyltransferase [Rikenellaceae bacterium]
MKDIAIYGAGGLGREIAALIELINAATPAPYWNFMGFFDDGKDLGKDYPYGKILGGMEELNNWEKPMALALCIGDSESLRNVRNRISNSLVYFPNLISPDIVRMDPKRLKIGKGNIIQHFTLFSVDVEIGDFNIFNCRTNVGHDTTIGSFNLFMPSVSISGGVTIGDGNFFGTASTVLQYLKIGNGVRVGANSLIIRHTKDNQLYIGSPATIFKS